jgi:hypothetical protein
MGQLYLKCGLNRGRFKVVDTKIHRPPQPCTSGVSSGSQSLMELLVFADHLGLTDELVYLEMF